MNQSHVVAISESLDYTLDDDAFGGIRYPYPWITIPNPSNIWLLSPNESIVNCNQIFVTYSTISRSGNLLHRGSERSLYHERMNRRLFDDKTQRWSRIEASQSYKRSWAVLYQH